MKQRWFQKILNNFLFELAATVFYTFIATKFTNMERELHGIGSDTCNGRVQWKGDVLKIRTCAKGGESGESTSKCLHQKLVNQ